MPRYVILRHDMPTDSDRGSHWDLMLEHAEVLKTWACDVLPGPDVSVEATQLPDHRLAYLEFEGPVSGNRGQVTRWDAGNYEVTCRSPRRWIVQLEGFQLAGCLTLTQVDESAEKWRATFSPS